MTGDLVKNTVTIKSDIDGEDYIFNLPSPNDEIKIGFVARSIRRRFDVDGDGSPAGLDFDTFETTYSYALFEVLLKAGPAWVYSETPGTNTEPVVNTKTWNATGKKKVITEVIKKLNDEVARFHKEREPNN